MEKRLIPFFIVAIFLMFGLGTAENAGSPDPDIDFSYNTPSDRSTTDSGDSGPSISSLGLSDSESSTGSDRSDSMVRGRENGVPKTENLLSEKIGLSSYGTPIELVGRGKTPDSQELTYRFKSADKSYSYIALAAAKLKKLEVFRKVNVSTKEKNGRKLVEQEKQELDYSKVMEVDKFLEEWKNPSSQLQHVKNQIRNSAINNLSSMVIPEGDTSIYRVEHSSGEWIYVTIKSSSDLKFLALDPAGAYANYDSGFSAPYCSSYNSSCVANTSLLMSRDNLGPGEPNSPNTIDSATDGTSSTQGYQSDESVENITVESLDNPAFGAGDQVRVTAWVYCFGNSDQINFVYSPSASSPSWSVQQSTGCPGSPGPFEMSTTFQTANQGGEHAFRVINGWNLGSSDTAGTSRYDDNDDLVVAFDAQIPSITLSSPSNQSIMNQGTQIDFSVQDQESGVEAVSYSLDNGANQSLSSPYSIDTSSWTDGTHMVKVYANDSAGNLNSKYYEFKIDANPPSVNLFSPDSKNYSKPDLWLNYSASDTYLDTVFYSLNSNLNTTLSGNTTFTAQQGLNNLEVYANDSVGKLDSSSVSFRVDSLQPSINLQSPANNSDVEQGSIIDYSISDTNLDSAVYNLNGDNKTDFINSYDLNTSDWNSGINEVKIYANDTFNNSDMKYYEFNITVNQPPVITLSQPDNNSVIYGTGFINFSVTDKSLASTYYNIEGGSNTSTVGTNDVDLSRSQEGDFWLNYFAEDSEGLVSGERYNFTVDNTDPRVKVFSPDNKTYAKKKVWLNYTSSDTHLESTFYSFNGGSNTTLTGNTTLTATEGSNQLYVYSNDSAGNVGKVPLGFTVDTTSPDIDISSPQNTTYFQKNVLANISLNEEGNICKYNLDSNGNVSMVQDSAKNFSAGLNDLSYSKHSVKFWCSDQVGNWNSTSVSFTTSKPASEYSSFFGAPYCSSGVSPCEVGESLIQSKDNLAVSEPNSPNTIDGATDGTSGSYQSDESVDEINVTDNDASTFGSGHSVTVSTKAYCYGTSDVVNILFANNTASPSWSVQYSQACGGSGFETHQTTFTWTGSGNVSVRSLIEYNGDGTTTSISSSYGDQDDVVIPLDNTPPKINLKDPSNTSVINSGEMLDFTFEDEMNYYDTAKYSLDGAANQTMSVSQIDTSSWSEGQHSLQVYVNDSAGNLNSKYYEFTVDDTAPQLQVFSPESRDYTYSDIWMNYTVSEPNLESVKYSINGNSNQTLNGNETFTASEGANSLNVYAEDLAGNVKGETVDFNVDSGSPTIDLDVPTNNSDVEQGSLVEYTVSDSNLDSVVYSLNGNNRTDFTNSYDLNTSDWSTGINEVKMYANDTFGNMESKYYEFNIKIDSPPAIVLNNPDNQSIIQGNRFINFSVSDNSLDSKWYYIAGERRTDLVGTGDIDLSRTIEGDFWLNYSANDTEGQTTTQDYLFTVDNTAPELKLFSPINKTYSNSRIWLNYSSSDIHLDSTFYSLNGGSNQTISGNKTITPPEGSNTLEVYAKDSAENIGSTSVQFSKDVTPPDITVFDPKNQTYFQSDVMANVTLNEEGGACYYNLDSTGNQSLSKNSDTEFSKQLLNLDKTQHSIKFWCKDIHDNWNQTSNIYFTLSEPSADYNSTIGAPYCAGGNSPCKIGESLIISKDNLATDEPNSPNTIDGATDGTSGTYDTDESVDGINITDWNASTFSSGHLVEISVRAHCWDTPSDDQINIITAQSFDNPSWTVQQSNSCSNAGFNIFSTNVTIPQSEEFVVRGLNEYNGGTGDTSVTSDYGDQDDVGIPLDNNAPSISLVSLDNQSVIAPGTDIDVLFDDPEGNLDSLKYIKDSGSNQSFSGTIDTSGWTDGTRSVKVWVNDTAANYNSNYFEFELDGTAPQASNIEERRNGNTVSRVYPGLKYNLSAKWQDAHNITEAVLSTNETGSFQNSSLASSKTLSSTSAYTNFTVELGDGKDDFLGWKIYSKDLVENYRSTSTQTVEVWEKANASWQSKESYALAFGQNAGFSCNLNKNIGGEAVSDYQVDFYIENQTSSYFVGSSTTDTSGEASIQWDSSGYNRGTYNPKCNISSNSQRQIEPIGDGDNATLELGIVDYVFKAEDKEGLKTGTNLTITDNESVTNKYRVDDTVSIQLNQYRNYTVTHNIPVTGSKDLEVTYYDFNASSDLEPFSQVVNLTPIEAGLTAQNLSDSGKGVKNLSEFYAVNSTGMKFGKTEIKMPVDQQPNSILHCTDWNFTSKSCKSNSWEINSTSDYSYSSPSGYMKFNVTEFDAFSTGNGEPLPNVTDVRVYDVEGLSQGQKESGGELLASGLNKTLNINQTNRTKEYRIEFKIRNDGSKDWTLQSGDELFHEGLNSSWSVGKKWYNISGTQYTGGTFSNGRVDWDTSQGGTMLKQKKNDDMWEKYLVNVSTTSSSLYSQHFLVNDTSNNAGSEDYHELNITKYGFLDVAVEKPPDGTVVSQNKTFDFNASVTCREGICGDVNVSARYNQSKTADTLIPENSGKPFHLTQAANTVECGTNLNSNETCYQVWVVNATGELLSEHLIDANATSNLAQVPENDSKDNEIKVNLAALIDVKWDAIDFGVIDPGVKDKPAQGNDNSVYNITVTENSVTIDNLWVKTSNLTASGWGDYHIPVENTSYALQNDISQEKQLSREYQSIASDISSGTNLTSYYWIDVPEGIKSGKYNSTIYIKANATR